MMAGRGSLSDKQVRIRYRLSDIGSYQGIALAIPLLLKIKCPFRGCLPFPPHAERVGYAVDVVEPGCNQRNLQDGLILEACGP
jgi:hypothetical protein